LLRQAKLSEVIGFSKPITLEFQSGEAKKIHLIGRHIPGTLNTEADVLSRPTPITGEWSLDLKSSCLLYNSLGVLEIDLLANPFSAKLLQFHFSLSRLESISSRHAVHGLEPIDIHLPISSGGNNSQSFTKTQIIQSKSGLDSPLFGRKQLG
jgi:hypothetical protein